MAGKTRWQEFRQALSTRIRFVELYRKLGVDIMGGPDSKGFVSCRAHPVLGGEDRTPSASINTKSGVYHDFRSGITYNVFDFMAAIGAAPSWKEAQLQLAAQYRIPIPSDNKTYQTPLFGVKPLRRQDSMLQTFCDRKAPITIAALDKAGVKTCKYKDQECIVFPVIDSRALTCGYHFLPMDGTVINLDKGKQAKSVTKKHSGAEAGLVGTPAVHRMLNGQLQQDEEGYEIPDLYWMEGFPDVLSAYAHFPDGFFFTNPNGCQESVTLEQMNFFRSLRANLYIVCDQDEPGLKGAMKRRDALLELANPDLQIEIITPYGASIASYEKKHGKDARDFLSVKEVGSLKTPLKDLFFKFEPEAEEKLIEISREEKAKQREDANRKKTAKILKELELTVLDTSGDGKILIAGYSGNVVELGFNYSKPRNIIQLLLGMKHGGRVHFGKPEDIAPGQIYVDSLMDALACEASRIHEMSDQMHGGGIHMLQIGDERFPAFNDNGMVHYYDGDEVKCVRGNDISTCRVDFREEIPGFQPAKLLAKMEDAKDPSWRRARHKELKAVIDQWPWITDEMSSLCVGLIYATWMQSLWKWRPIVSVFGESGSGKTYLMDFITRLTLNAMPSMTNSTVNGIQQIVGRSSYPMIVDEFDTARNRTDFLKVFRASSRGQTSVKGTASHTAKVFRLKHMPWVSGIHSGSDAQADNNRTISLELVANGSVFGLPGSEEIEELGYSILACCIRAADEALDFAVNFSRVPAPEGLESRYVESYSVPYAAACAVCDLKPHEVSDAMVEHLHEYVSSTATAIGSENDQESLLQEVMSARVYLGSNAPSTNARVSDILFKPIYRECREELSLLGVEYRAASDLAGRPAFVAFDMHQMASQDGALSRHKDLGKRGSYQIMHRLKNSPLGAKSERRGSRLYLVFEYESLKAWFMGPPKETGQLKMFQK